MENEMSGKESDVSECMREATSSIVPAEIKPLTTLGHNFPKQYSTLSASTGSVHRLSYTEPQHQSPANTVTTTSPGPLTVWLTGAPSHTVKLNQLIIKALLKPGPRRRLVRAPSRLAGAPTLVVFTPLGSPCHVHPVVFTLFTLSCVSSLHPFQRSSHPSNCYKAVRCQDGRCGAAKRQLSARFVELMFGASAAVLLRRGAATPRRSSTAAA
ncbi:unnamed protein product [Arctogadus glacialis]